MNTNTDELYGMLFARLDDLCRFSDDGIVGSSCFLSPRELHFARQYLSRKGRDTKFLEWGGYNDAERKKIFFLPEYAESVDSYASLLEFGFEDELATLVALGSGYRKIGHRDFLGALLGLGLRREVLGDILILDGDAPSALIICEKSVAEFIKNELKKVGSDTVKLRDFELSGDFCPERRFLHMSDTVASARADCVVAALCNLSREKARAAIEDGLLEVEYEKEERADRIISAPAVLSIRGLGKFRINSVSEPTKKGRLRLDADKYL